MRYEKNIFPLILISLYLGCNDNVVEPLSPEPDVIMSLAVGNYWIYERVKLNHDGSIRFVIGKIGRRIKGKTTINYNGGNIQCYVEKNYIPEYGDSMQTDWLFSENNGNIYTTGGINDSSYFYTNSPYLKYPSYPGDFWEFPNLAFNYQTGLFEQDSMLVVSCIDTAAEFVTSIDTFKCYEYYHRFFEDGGDYKNTWDIYRYYAPNIGEVGNIIYGYVAELDSSILFSKSILIDYKLY